MCTCTQQRMLRPCSAHDGVAKKHLRDPTGAACEACQKRMDKEENNQEKQVLSGSHQLWRHMQKFQPSQAKTRNDGPVCYHVFVWCVSACGCAGVRARGGRRACARACGCVLCVCECVSVCVCCACLFKPLRLCCERCWHCSWGLHGYTSCSRYMPQHCSM